MPEKPTDLVSLRDARERTIARLSDLFAEDHLDVEEFDRRLTVAHRAATLAELEELTRDYGELAPATTALATTNAPTTNQIVPSSSARESQSMLALFGGVTRKGQWTSPRKIKITAVMGGAQLDFREARLPAGVTEIQVTAVMGGVHIIVPPGLAVEVNGSAIMGGFDHMERSPLTPDPDRAVLSVGGFAMMGGVHIETRLPGEDEHAAHRRASRERKELRRAHKEERKRLTEGAAKQLPKPNTDSEH